jgi:hypothetical protein
MNRMRQRGMNEIGLLQSFVATVMSTWVPSRLNIFWINYVIFEMQNVRLK